MKKYIIILISLFASINLWCTWEGNGLAGAATDFAEDGMFVKSSLLPKYSLVEVTNLENDIKVRAIVLDGKDVPGILMSFSPSVAEALKVSYGAVARIRVMSPNVVEEGDSFAKEEILAEAPEEVASKKENIEEPKKEEMALKEDSALIAEKESNEDVILYDFKPIAKNIEKKGKDEGAISFDPAFIEEEVILDIRIPDTPLPESPTETEKVEEKKEEKKEASVVPPKTVGGTEKREVFLEKTALRPPKEVSIPSVKENNVHVAVAKVEEAPSIKKVSAKEELSAEKQEVKSVLVPEKKEEKRIEAVLIVPQVKDVKKPEEKKEEKISTVGEVKKIVPKKEDVKEVKIEDVSSAPVIVGKTEKEKENIKDVQEIAIPKVPKMQKEKQAIPVKEVKVPVVKEIRRQEDGITRDTPSVIEVDAPRRKDSLNDNEVAKVPIVQAIKEAKKNVLNAEPMARDLDEKPPLFDDVVGEPVLEEEDVMEEESLEEPLIDELEPIEEEIEEEPLEEPLIEEIEEVKEVKQGKMLDERPLREIEVYSVAGRLNEEPSKEKMKLSKEKDMVAIDNYDVEATSEKDVKDMSEKALEEVSVEKKEKMQEAKNEYDEDEIVQEKHIKGEMVKEEIKPIERKEERGIEKEEVRKEELKKEEVKPEEIKLEASHIEEKESFPIGKIVKGYSYVQIGVFGNAQRVEELLKKYGYSYPIVVEKRGNGLKTNYVVFVGPLQKDEVGAVQESFRSFGFKDAF